jgi:hydroxypyruvate reductase 1
MATLAACNVAGSLLKRPAWNRPDVTPFLVGTPPQASPSILNATEVGIPIYKG